MKKYFVPLLIIGLVFTFLLFIINRKNMTDTKIYLDDNLYNEKHSEISIKKSKLEKLIKNKSNMVVFFSMPYCTFDVPCENVFKDVFENAGMSFYSISYSDIKGSEINKQIKYAPSIAIFKKGEIIAYLDPNSDEDTKKYESKKEFKSWLSKYVYLERWVLWKIILNHFI